MTHTTPADYLETTYGAIFNYEHDDWSARVHPRTGDRTIAIRRPNVPHGAGYGHRAEDGRVTRSRGLSSARTVWGSDVALDGPALGTYYTGGREWTIYAVTGGTAPTGERVAADDLNTWAEFGSPFRVHNDLTVSPAHDEPDAYRAPEVVYTDEGTADTVDGVPEGWHALTGYTGQHGYSGPIMHESETLSGGMARDVLTRPGLYVVVTVDDYTEDDTPAGWAVLTLPDA